MYPIAPCNCRIEPATPSLPFWPSPTGHFTLVLLPTALFQSALTFDR